MPVTDVRIDPCRLASSLNALSPIPVTARPMYTFLILLTDIDGYELCDNIPNIKIETTDSSSKVNKVIDAVSMIVHIRILNIYKVRDSVYLY